MMNAKELRARRKLRTRYSLRDKAAGRLRLSVHRTGQHIYAQVIDLANGGKILAEASTLSKELRAKLKKTADKAAASAVGKLVAERALKAGVKQVAFDRGGYPFHGRVSALAEAAREAGLDF